MSVPFLHWHLLTVLMKLQSFDIVSVNIPEI